MSDPNILMGAASLVSTVLSAGGLYRAARAGAELARLETPPIGRALDQAFNCGRDVPPDMSELLDKLD